MMQEQDNTPVGGLQDGFLEPDPAVEATENQFEQELGTSADASNSGNIMLSARNSNVILAILFAAGMAVVYALSIQGGPDKADAKQNSLIRRVDATIMQVKRDAPKRKASKAKAEIRADELYLRTLKQQIPLSELSDNPFVFTLPSREVDPGDMNDAAANGAARTAAALARAHTLDLQSIIVGETGQMAVISDQLLTVGQTIRTWKVTFISDSKVVLAWGTMTYTLRIKQD